MEFSLYAAVRFPLRLLSFSLGCHRCCFCGSLQHISNNNVTRRPVVLLLLLPTFPWRFQCRTKNKVKRVANTAAAASVDAAASSDNIDSCCCHPPPTFYQPPPTAHLRVSAFFLCVCVCCCLCLPPSRRISVAKSTCLSLPSSKAGAAVGDGRWAGQWAVLRVLDAEKLVTEATDG